MPKRPSAFSAHKSKQLKSFAANDFAELLELQKRSMQWLIIAMQTRAELRISDPRIIAGVSIPVMLKLRVWQLRN